MSDTVALPSSFTSTADLDGTRQRPPSVQTAMGRRNQGLLMTPFQLIATRRTPQGMRPRRRSPAGCGRDSEWQSSVPTSKPSRAMRLLAVTRVAPADLMCPERVVSAVAVNRNGRWTSQADGRLRLRRVQTSKPGRGMKGAVQDAASARGDREHPVAPHAAPSARHPHARAGGGCACRSFVAVLARLPHDRLSRWPASHGGRGVTRSGRRQRGRRRRGVPDDPASRETHSALF